MVRVRNGADVLLKQLFVGLGGRYGLAVFGLLLVGGGAALIGRDIRRSGGIRPRYFVFMAAESIAYGLVFGIVAGTLTGLLLPRLAHRARRALGLPAQVMVSLGAGIYEELVFRVLLVSGLMLIAQRRASAGRGRAPACSRCSWALSSSRPSTMSGAYGERFALGSFTFRAIAGLLFSALYLLRGFGITAWTHALYDVFLAL